MLHNEWKTLNEDAIGAASLFKWLTNSFLNCVCVHVCVCVCGVCVNEQKWAIWDTAGNINRGDAGIAEGHRLELGHALDAVLSS